MEKIEKFFSYYEGNLGEDAESSFFAELAVDKDLRAEFKAFNSVAATLPEKVNVFKPSADQKSRLFSKAGFTMPDVLPPSSGIVNTPAITDSGFSWIYSKGILQAVIASFFTVLIMLYLMRNDKSALPVNESVVSAKAKTVPKMESYAENSIRNNHPENTKPEIRYIYVNRYIPVEVNRGDGNISNTEYQEIYSDEIAKSEILKTNTFSNDMRPVIKNENINFGNNLYSPFNFNDINFDKNWEIIVEQSIPWNIPEEKINPESFSKFNNTSVKILYKLNDYIKIGAGAGQSTFYTEYEGYDEEGSLYRYRQQPNLTTFSGEVSFKLLDVSDFKPYLQLGLGGNAAGFVVNPALGVEYKLADNFSLYLGCSYDYFRFSHQEKWYDTQKLRLSYGVSFKM